MTTRVKLYTGFIRFWHWTQAALIFGLLFTGFAIYGIHHLMPFGTALEVHLALAWLLIGLWAFAIFWHVTTGQWRQYLPTTRGLLPMVLYYAYGIFSGEPKPFTVTPAARHNPLQRLAYLGFKLLIAPALWVSGLLLMFVGAWKTSLLGDWLQPDWVAAAHLAAAYALVVFLIGHVYMAATTGTPWNAYLKAMLTGYQEVKDSNGKPG
ncbi:cytochrome B [Thiohalocapsa marina]|uniref:Cytochrome B n=1 Tax=Thiohalocapsa marina TaxID=424902 RepID=A0A5M8FNL0_9GAMM|nr:cytochrome b/b6 domain-containing protein [Thiohalocapsa marina]KAA6186064.1 cytochrome B [Thiohalocapsa marina]